MPHRFPPPEPKPLSVIHTQTQLRRHRTIMDAWYVGNALREYDETLRLSRTRDLPDDVPYLVSPSFTGSGARRLADNGTPTSMDAICQWIDRQQITVKNIKRAYASLQQSLPIHARIAWLYHVELFTCQEIAEVMRVSYRTVVRYLGVANLYLAAELNIRSDSPTARSTGRSYQRQAAQQEADAWRAPDEEPTIDVLVAAGQEKALEVNRKSVVRRARKR